jgi:hypothetical protein
MLGRAVIRGWRRDPGLAVIRGWRHDPGWPGSGSEP